jgi:hypothetical protein
VSENRRGNRRNRSKDTEKKAATHNEDRSQPRH